MKLVAGLAIAAAALAGARVARVAAEQQRVGERAAPPYAPTPAAAPFVSMGYRELGADLLFVRLSSYFGGDDTEAPAMASLVDAIVALDPSFYNVYEYGARAITLATRGVDQAAFQRSIAVLERGIHQFPDDWKLPYLAGQIYTQDLVTTDPAQRRAWDDKGTLLVESAIRKPGAPAQAAEWAVAMRTKLGQHERAIRELHEMLLVTTDDAARKRLVNRLAELEHADADELAAEIFEERKRFEAAWKHDRPGLPASIYVLLGPRLPPRFDMADLASGGRDLIGSEPIEKLEPLQ